MTTIVVRVSFLRGRFWSHTWIIARNYIRILGPLQCRRWGSLFASSWTSLFLYSPLFLVLLFCLFPASSILLTLFGTYVLEVQSFLWKWLEWVCLYWCLKNPKDLEAASSWNIAQNIRKQLNIFYFSPLQASSAPLLAWASWDAIMSLRKHLGHQPFDVQPLSFQHSLLWQWNTDPKNHFHWSFQKEINTLHPFGPSFVSLGYLRPEKIKDTASSCESL